MEGLSRRRFVPDMLIRSTYKLTSTSLPWTAGSLAHLQRVAVDRQTYHWLHVCVCVGMQAAPLTLLQGDASQLATFTFCRPRKL